MSTPLLVEVKDRSRPKFKWHPYKSVDTEPLGAFSSMSYGVLHIEDIREYVHANIKDLGSVQLFELYSNPIVQEDFTVKLEFKTLVEKKFAQFAKFPIFEEDEWVHYILSKVHDEFMLIDTPFKITKEAICVVTSLNSFGRLLVLKSMKNDDVTKATDSH